MHPKENKQIHFCLNKYVFWAQISRVHFFLQPWDFQVHTYIIIHNHSYIHTYRQTDRQKTDRQTDGQAGRQAGRQTDRHTDTQTHRQTDRQPASQPARQADRQTDRQTYIYIYIHTHIHKFITYICPSLATMPLFIYCGMLWNINHWESWGFNGILWNIVEDIWRYMKNTRICLESFGAYGLPFWEPFIHVFLLGICFFPCLALSYLKRVWHTTKGESREKTTAGQHPEPGLWYFGDRTCYNMLLSSNSLIIEQCWNWAKTC